MTTTLDCLTPAKGNFKIYQIYHSLWRDSNNKGADVNHCRSPLTQGGLELPVEVTVTMENTEKNNVATTKYRDLVTCSYKEAVDGRFEDVTDTILKQLNDSESSSASGSDSEIDETDDV